MLLLNVHSLNVTSHSFMFAQMFHLDDRSNLFHLTQCMHTADMKMWLTDLVLKMTDPSGHGIYDLEGYSMI